jgi:dipeptidyl aminopeptidase/acylaminoacyl peptidase
MQSRFIFSIYLLVFASVTFVHAQTGIDTLQLKTIFDEPFLPGNRPTPAGFDPTGRTVYFNWNDSAFAANKVYKINVDGSNLRETPQSEQMLRRGTVSPDKKRILYTDSGNLMVAHSDGSNARVLVASMGNDNSGIWSSNGDRVAYISNGDVWVIDLNQAQIRQVTRRESGAPGYILRSWANNDSILVVSQTDNRDNREIFFPEYIDTFVSPGGSRRGVATISLHTIHIESRKLETLLTGKVSLRGVAVSPSGRYVLTDQADEYLKNREIGIFDLQNSNAYSVIHQERTEGWISTSFGSARFAPTSDRISFTSEQDGWEHIYLVNPDSSDPIQLTSGQWEASWYQWLDDQRIVYVSNEVDPGVRHLVMADLRRNRHTTLTEGDQYRTDFTISPDKKHVAFRKSWFNQPDDLYVINVDRPRGEVQLTNSVPERFKQIDWSMPEYIRFTGRDGETMLSMELIKPYDFEPTKQYPVVVFVHGAGSLQNVYKGWSGSYWREYLFHHFLAKNGYVVIEVDYRHSLGYGRKFREDVTNWMGKYELEDIIDGIDYVAKDGYIDVNRVGVYGGSYGGFMALYAVSQAPERFHAAAALRAVTNWENYYYANPWYTGPRLGHPDEHRENYDRSSPLTFADSLSRPALILHGLVDSNVGFQDAMQYVEKLIQSGNTEFDLMVYPSENHGFVSPRSWYDEYLRIYNYFERYLK